MCPGPLKPQNMVALHIERSAKRPGGGRVHTPAAGLSGRAKPMATANRRDRDDLRRLRETIRLEQPPDVISGETIDAPLSAPKLIRELIVSSVIPVEDWRGLSVDIQNELCREHDRAGFFERLMRVKLVTRFQADRIQA